MLDWQLFFDGNPTALLVVDWNLTVLAASTAAMSLTFTPGERLAAPFPEASAGALEEWARLAIAGQSQPEPLRLDVAGSDSKWRRFSFDGRVVENDGSTLLLVSVHVADGATSEETRLKAIGMIARFAVHETNNSCGGALLAAENGRALLGQKDQSAFVVETFGQIIEAMQNCGRMAHELLAFARADHAWRSDWSLHELVGRAAMLTSKLAPAGSPRLQVELQREDATLRVNGLEVCFIVSQLFVRLASETQGAESVLLQQYGDQHHPGFELATTSAGPLPAARHAERGEYARLVDALIRSHRIECEEGLLTPNDRYIRLMFSGQG